VIFQGPLLTKEKRD